MAILGLTRQGDMFRFVLCDYANGALAAQKFGEVLAASWGDAITTLAGQTGARDLAVAIEPPGLSIQEVDVSNLTKDTEKRGAARNKAVMAGFDDRDDIRVRTDEDGNWYFAALRAELKREIPNGNATSIAQTLTGVVQSQAFVSAVDAHTVVVSGDAQTVTRAQKLAQQLGGGADYALDTIAVRYRPASSIVASLASMHISDGSPIYANDAASSVLVGGTATNRENIARMIRALDVPTNTITFDMYVLDVQPMNQASNRGVLWGQPIQGQSGQIAITPGAMVATLGTGYKVPIGVQINELLSNGAARLLASPQLTVASGSANDFTNGGSYPIAVANGGLIGGQNVQYFQFGILIHIAATIGANGDVAGSIKASDSDIVGFDPASHLPIISNRSDAVDNIPMHEGEPIIISGMFSDTQSDVLEKLPVLGDIPPLGGFFRNRQTTHKQDQLTFVIVPHRGSSHVTRTLLQELQGATK